MGQPTRNFTPGRAALGRHEARDVVKNNDVAAARPFGQLRASQGENLRLAARSGQFNLELPFLAAEFGKCFEDRHAECLLARPGVDGAVYQTLEIVAQDFLCAFVNRAQAGLTVKDQDPRRKIGQNRFKIGVR